MDYMYYGEKSPVVIGSGKEKGEKWVGGKNSPYIRSWRQLGPAQHRELETPPWPSIG
jgi:hypothetical protein